MAEQRLPTVNGDDGAWGDILNQYLAKEHYNTGINNAANGGHKTVTLQAGTTTAGTAPLKFASGSNLTAPEAGAVEWNGTNLYITQTSGPTRKTIAYTDSSITGNASTATKFAATKNINGVAFDGSADITVPTLPISTAPTTQTAQGIIVPMVYGEAITIGQLLYFKSDGKVYKADSTSIATAKLPCMGLALATASSGTNNVLLLGTYRDTTKWTGGTVLTVGGMCYMSTAGGTTQTQPASTDNVIQVVGVAVAADTIYFNPVLTYITRT